MGCRSILAFAAAVWMAWACPHSRAHSEAVDNPEIWFGPKDPFRAVAADRGSPEYMQLFQPGAGWAKAAGYVRVFKLYPQLMRRASDADLKTILQWLKVHQIALAIETGLMRPLSYCRRTEGYDTDQLEMAQRVRRLGGDLRYVAADSPLLAGHSFSGPGACQLPIAAMAQSTAKSARLFQSVFSQVQFVDIEAISNFKKPTWVAEIGQFHDAFRQAYGQPFIAMNFDVAWWQPGWQQRVRTLTQYLRRRGERIGVIYDGNPNARSDREWLNQAREHYREYETLVGSPPDEAIFQSWHKYPKRLLPDTDPNAFTSIILDYVRFEQSLASRRSAR